MVHIKQASHIELAQHDCHEPIAALLSEYEEPTASFAKLITD